MTILLAQGVKAKPGRLPELLEAVANLRPAIQERGGGRARLMRIATGGPSAGEMYGEVEFDDYAAYGRFSDRVAEDGEYQRLLDGVFGPGGPGIRAESFLAQLTHEFGSAREGHQGAAELIRDWTVIPGRMEQFIALAEQATAIAEELGGRVRLFTLVVGGNLTGMVSTVAEFPSITALGEYADMTSQDPGLREIFSKALGPDTPAILGSNQIHREVALPPR